MRFAVLTVAALALGPAQAAPQEGRLPLEGKWLCLRVDDRGVPNPNLVGQVMT
jgi:hypothetical protein